MKLFILVFLIQIIAISAWAGKPEQLSWAAAVEETRKNNQELKASENTLYSTEYTINAAYSGFMPQVTGALGYNNGGTPGQSSGTYSASLTATENLFSGFQDKARVNQASANTRVAQATFQSTKAKISYDLKTTFSGLNYAQKSITLSETINKRREDNYKMVALRFQSGQENKGSVLLSKAYLNQASYEVLQAKNNLDFYRIQLAKVLGRDIINDLTLTEQVPTSTPPSNLKNFESLAVSSPAHTQAVAQEEAADAAVTLARGGFFPSLSLNGSTYNQDSTWFPQSNHWSVGATLSIPLFSGFKDYYSTKSSSEAYASASANRHNTDLLALVNLSQYYKGYVEAVEKVKVDDSFLQAANARAEIGRNKYKNGLITFDEWDIIENDLITREKTFLQTERDRITAEAAWEQVQGKGVIP